MKLGKTLFLALINYALFISGSGSSVNIEGFTSIRQTKNAVNNTVSNKIQEGLDYILGFSPRDSFGLLSQTTPDVIIFFLFLHSVMKDNMMLGNLYLEASNEFNYNKRRKTVSVKKLLEYREWLDQNFNFPPTDIYNSVKWVASGKSRGVNDIPEIIAKPILLLDKKYKILEYFCSQNDLIVIKWFLDSGYEISNIGINVIQESFQKNNIDLVRLILSYDFLQKVNSTINVNAEYKGKQTLLHVASYGGLEKVVSYLIEKKANVNAVDELGRTPIYRALESNKSSVVRLLAQNGGVLDKTYGQYGDSLIHIAASLGNVAIMKTLIDLNLKVNSQNDNGDTALHIAAKKFNESLMLELLRLGLQVNVKNYFGDTPLHTAVFEGNLLSIRFLIRHGAYLYIKNNLGHPPIFRAVEGKHIEAIKEFVKINASMINTVADSGDTLLHLAADIGDSVLINSLISMGAQINKINNYLHTPLYRAALKGNEMIVRLLQNKTNLMEINNGLSMLHEAARDGNPNAVRALLSTGIYINSRAFWGYTPLHIAAGQGHLEVVKLLLSKRADPNIKSKNSHTPLHMAALGGHLEVTKALIDSCADPAVFAANIAPIDLAKKVKNSEKHKKVVAFLTNKVKLCGWRRERQG